MTYITIPRATVEQALDALEYAQQDRECPSTTRQALAALKAALAEFNPDWDRIEALQESLREHMAEIHRLRAKLAEPVQEPVAWLIEYEGDEREVRFVAGTRGIRQTPLYTAPPQPQRKPLTEEEIMNLCAAQWASHPVEVARVVEQAHGIKE